MTDEGPDDVTIRRATPADHAAVLSVLDGATLETDAAAVRAAIDRDACVVAEPTDASGEAVLVGALVLDGPEIVHVAVRRRRRGLGIGTALVAAVAEERDSIVAAFPADVRPFYASLGFEIEPVDDAERSRGRLRSD